jgi:hypothetical protein
MGGVFINYRVADMSHGASHIDLELVREFGADQVFRDCRSMEPGEHYPTALREALKGADVLVAVIGPEWLAVRNKETGVRRIDEEGDWVRHEIHEAMSRDMPVIPVLLQGADKARRLTAEDLPEQIRGFAYLQSMVIDFRRYEEDIKRLIARVAKLVPQVVLAKLFAVPEADPEPGNAPSTVLRPEYRAVPLIGRGEEIADLTSWANQPAACTAGLIAGPAGSGKTRLAQALCAQLRTQGWLAGIVSGQAPAGKIGHTSGIDKPLLAVVDDVELRADQLVALAGAMGDRSAARNAPARLLLLGRSAGDWLADLCRHRDPQVSELFKTIGQDSTITLRAEPGRSQEWFAHAFTAFAGRFGLPAATPVPIGPVTESLVDTQAASLVAVLERGGHAGQTDGQPDPLVRLLICDQAHWTDETGLSGSGLAMLATVATLCPPASDEQARALLSRLPAFHADDHHPMEEYAQRLRRLYPGPYELNPIRPAALGERLIVITLETAPALVTVLADTGTDEQLRTALTVLGRALPRHSGLAEAVMNLLRVDPSRLTPLAVEVIARLEDPEPFVRAVVSVMSDGNLSKTAVLRLVELVGTVRRESLNPVKAKLLRALQETLAGPLMDLTRHDATARNPALVPLQTIADNLVKLLQDGAEWFFDPKGAPIPKGLDGGGNPMMGKMWDMLREYTINRDWWRDDESKK